MRYWVDELNFILPDGNNLIDLRREVVGILRILTFGTILTLRNIDDENRGTP